MARKKKEGSASDLPYFSQIQEKAVVEYLSILKNKRHRQLYPSEIEQCNNIYNSLLKAPLRQMAESIINKYQLWSKTMTYEEFINDILGYLHEKIECFDPERLKKSYSYYGTIIKRRAIAIRQKEDKEKKQISSFEIAYDSLIEDERFSEEEGDVENDPDVDDLFDFIVGNISNLVENESKGFFKSLKEKERDIFVGIKKIMDNWQEERKAVANIKKEKAKAHFFERLCVLTSLSLKDLRAHIKNIKKWYQHEKKSFLFDGDDYLK